MAKEEATGGPLYERIQDLKSLAKYVLDRMQPMLDLATAIQTKGFVVEVCGKSLLKFKVGV